MHNPPSDQSGDIPPQMPLRLGDRFANAVYEHSAAAMAVCNRDGRFIGVNAAMCSFLGYSEAELLARTFVDVTHPDDVEENISKRNALLSNSCDAIQIEKRYLHKSGEMRWALTVVSVVRDDAGSPLFTIGQMLDIGELKRTENALRKSRESLARAQQLANLGDWEWQIATGLLLWSDEIYRIFGLEQGSTVASYPLFLSCVHPDDRPMVESAVARAIGRGERYEIDHRICRPDGEVRVVHEIGSVSCNAAGQPEYMRGTVQDITERHLQEQTVLEYQARIQQLAAHEALLIEAERKRIAREIHDEIGQLLTVLKIDMQLFRATMDRDNVATQRIGEMLAMVDETIVSVRNVTHNLRPPALNLGLIAALEWLAEDFKRRTPLGVVLDCRKAGCKLDDQIATAAFRVAQESLTNIVRHSRATQARITVSEEDQRLRVTIADNGVGFDIAQSSASGGFGLLGMRERIIALGGEFHLESNIDSGTTIRFWLPGIS